MKMSDERHRQTTTGPAGGENGPRQVRVHPRGRLCAQQAQEAPHRPRVPAPSASQRRHRDTGLFEILTHRSPALESQDSRLLAMSCKTWQDIHQQALRAAAGEADHEVPDGLPVLAHRPARPGHKRPRIRRRTATASGTRKTVKPMA